MGLYLDATGGLDAIVKYLPSPSNIRDISASKILEWFHETD